MTLIFSHRSPKTGLFTLSDTLVSASPKYAPESVELPFRDAPLRHEAQGLVLRDLQQKTTIASRTLLMWAGEETVALEIFRRIMAESNDGLERIDLLATIDWAFKGGVDARTVSIIYHYNLGPNEVFIDSWNCEALEEPGAHSLIGTGTGVKYFFDTLSLRGDDGPEYETVLKSFHSKIVGHALYQGEGTASLDHLYGGWFEIACKTEDSFQKIPYAIKRWFRREGILGSGGPAYLGWYAGNSLIVTRHQLVERDGRISNTFRHKVVPDCLGRDRNFVAPTDVNRPFFIAHIVTDEDARAHLLLLDSHPSSEDMVFEADERCVRVFWTDKLRERLLNLEADSGMVVSDDCMD